MCKPLSTNRARSVGELARSNLLTAFTDYSLADLVLAYNRNMSCAAASSIGEHIDAFSSQAQIAKQIAIFRFGFDAWSAAVNS